MNNAFKDELLNQQRLGFTSGQKIGTWEHNGSAIVAISRPEGTVVLVNDGTAAKPDLNVKGRTWLKNLGYKAEVTNQIMDDTDGVNFNAGLFYSKTAAKPSLTEQALFNTATTSGSTLTNPISLTNTGTTNTVVTEWYKTTNGQIGLGAGILAFLGLLWYAFKKKK